MWFRSRSASRFAPRSLAAARRMRRSQKRRRGLFLEKLEDRRLLAFNLLGEYSAGFYPHGLALAPIDADQRLDLVTVNPAHNGTVSFRAGNSDGSFGLPLQSAAGTSPRSLAVGDFTGDGVHDLVTAHDSNLSILVGNGDGAFQSPVVIPLPHQPISSYPPAGSRPQYPYSVAVGDLNGDGKLDLAVGGLTSFDYCFFGGYCYTYTDTHVNVLLGNGSGGFTPSTAKAHHRGPGPISIADVNNDGRRDVLTSGWDGLTAFLGDGNGGLGDSIHSASGRGFSSVSLGDLDGDGKIDTMLRALNAPRQIIVHKGAGDGTFQPTSTIDMNADMDTAVIGDVNADGKLDIVAVGSTFTCTHQPYYCEDGITTRHANVVLGTGQGGFASPVASPLGSDPGAYLASRFVAVALADLTADGWLDLVALDQIGGRAVVAESSWPPADAPVLSVSSATIVEKDAGVTTLTLTASLSKAYSRTVTANFRTDDGTATAGSDYTAHSGTLTFAPGQTSKSISLSVHGDRLSEADESILVRLWNVVNAIPGDPGMVTIIDNEPQISINHQMGTVPLTVVEGDSGTKPAVFTVSLAQPYDQEVTVEFYTSTSNASDITSTSGVLRFAPGETRKDVTVQIVGDLLDEYPEEFAVHLTNPSSNAYLVGGPGYGNIEDNDPTPMVSINNVSKNEGHSGITTFTFTVSLSSPSGHTVAVWYSTADGTATTSNQDYVAASGYVYFEVGATTSTINVDVKGDTKAEGNDAFFVNLGEASYAMVVDGQGIGTIVNDDGATSSPSITVSDASVAEGNSGTKLMTFTVSLSQASSQQVKVSYATANGTARTSDNDYVAKSGTLTFARGETTKAITITIRGDRKVEYDEYFFVNLSKAVGGTITDSQGIATILNDDGANAAKKQTTRSPAARTQGSDLMAVGGAIEDWFKHDKRTRRR